MSDLYADTVRWWGYLRVSTSAQALDGYGLDTQLEGIRTWVAGNGGRLAGHSKDAGASGALDLDQRDGLLDAVFQCQRNGYRGIVVYRLDRLSRDPVGLEMILREFTKLGIEVHSCSSTEDGLVGVDGEDPARTLVRQILAAVNQYERQMIRFRLAAGKARKMASGGYTGGAPPYGFELDPDRRGELREVPDEMSAIAQALTMREMGLSYQTVGTFFEAHGFRLKRGKKWHAQVVKQVINGAIQRGYPLPAPLGPLARHFAEMPAQV